MISSLQRYCIPFLLVLFKSKRWRMAHYFIFLTINRTIEVANPVVGKGEVKKPKPRDRLVIKVSMKKYPEYNTDRISPSLFFSKKGKQSLFQQCTLLINKLLLFVQITTSTFKLPKPSSSSFQGSEVLPSRSLENCDEPPAAFHI